MIRPKLACCNFLSDTTLLREFALEHHFDGIDWSFTFENLPQSPSEEYALVPTISSLYPLEVRYHCAFKHTDLGDIDAEEARNAGSVFRKVCKLVSKVGGRYLTIHVGLGRDSTLNLSWKRTVEGLTDLVRFAHNLGVRLCLENLAWGWTSRPELLEKLIRKSGSWATLDIGHAYVSPSVMSGLFRLDDFVIPHPERFLNAHIYDTENGEGHVPPTKVSDLDARLDLLRELPLCDWWVLELREEKAVLEALRVVREYLRLGSEPDGKE
ncbi:MAG: sugar phosphate isomerase/epimerase [Deltaproteobacteria bacterium]